MSKFGDVAQHFHWFLKSHNIGEATVTIAFEDEGEKYRFSAALNQDMRTMLLVPLDAISDAHFDDFEFYGTKWILKP